MLDKSKPAIALIERLIRGSKVVGFDESGCYCKGKLNWSWIAQTTYLTLVFRGAGRGAKVLEDRFGDSLKNMVAVTDRHSAYFAIDFLNNQVYLAHLLRNLEYLNDIDTRTRIEDFDLFVKWLADKGISVISIDLHHDEGHADPLTDDLLPNHHAHIIVD